MKKKVFSLFLSIFALIGCDAAPIESSIDNVETSEENNNEQVIQDNNIQENNNENSDNEINSNNNKENETNNNNNNNENNNNDNKSLKEMSFDIALETCKALKDNEETTYEVKLLGLINTDPSKGTSGNFKFNIVDPSNSNSEFITIYYLESANGEAPANGDTVEIIGIMQNYYKNNKHTYEFVSGKYTITQRGEIGSQTGNSGEDEGHSSSGDANKYNIKDVMPNNTPIDISEGVNYSWIDSDKQVDYSNAPEWDFYNGTSNKPSGNLWGNGKDTGGIEFQRNCYMISPMFVSDKKIETRFTFHLSYHSNKKYNPYSNEPFFIFEEYDKDGNLLNDPKLKQPCHIETSKANKMSDEEKENKNIFNTIPNNNTLTIKTYLDNDNCAFFVLRFSNYLSDQAQGGYTCILNNAYIKSWQYDL